MREPIGEFVRVLCEHGPTLRMAPALRTGDRHVSRQAKRVVGTSKGELVNLTLVLGVHAADGPREGAAVVGRLDTRFMAEGLAVDGLCLVIIAVTGPVDIAPQEMRGVDVAGDTGDRKCVGLVIDATREVVEFCAATLWSVEIDLVIIFREKSHEER